jgi:hypothetical protein
MKKLAAVLMICLCLAAFAPLSANPVAAQAQEHNPKNPALPVGPLITIPLEILHAAKAVHAAADQARATEAKWGHVADSIVSVLSWHLPVAALAGVVFGAAAMLVIMWPRKSVE